MFVFSMLLIINKSDFIFPFLFVQMIPHRLKNRSMKEDEAGILINLRFKIFFINYFYIKFIYFFIYDTFLLKMTI